MECSGESGYETREGRHFVRYVVVRAEVLVQVQDTTVVVPSQKSSRSSRQNRQAIQLQTDAIVSLPTPQLRLLTLSGLAALRPPRRVDVISCCGGHMAPCLDFSLPHMTKLEISKRRRNVWV